MLTQSFLKMMQTAGKAIYTLAKKWHVTCLVRNQIQRNMLKWLSFKNIVFEFSFN